MTTKFEPTKEQELAIDAHVSGEDLKLSAFAGTGKTTTLAMMANATNRRGLYLAFNKAIVDDTAGEFPNNVQCRTIHSLAFRGMVDQYGSDKMVAKLFPWQASTYFDFSGLAVGTNRGRGIVLSEDMLASIALEIVRKYCNSDFDFIDERSIPSIGYFKPNYLTHDSITELVQKSVSLAKVMWEAMIDARSDCPLGHDGYLKLFALSKPNLRAQYVLVDEAQDSNGVTMSILQAQKDYGAQLNLVGDKQQSIYSWRGATLDLLSSYVPGDDLYLTESFRFGPEIASAASAMLRELGEDRPIIGRGQSGSVQVNRHYQTVLCRSNGGVLREALRLLNKDKEVHIAGGIADLEKEVVNAGRLKDDDKPIKSVGSILYGFDSWKEVKEAIENEDDSAPIEPGLKVLVGCLDKYGADQIVNGLRSATTESRADFIISTAHKAKGRQWDDVCLSDDFKSDDDDGETDEDKRLLYVAVTRAKRRLSVPPEMAERLGLSD